MKVFVSDAAGYNGEPIVRALTGMGHSVVGLVRNEAEAGIVRDAGGSPVVGDLRDNGSWCNEIREVDKVISLVEPYDIVDGIPERTDEATRRYGESVTNLIKAASESRADTIVLTYSTTCFGHREGKWVEGEPGAMLPAGLCSPASEWIDVIEDEANASGKHVIRLFHGLVYDEFGWLAAVANRYSKGEPITVMPNDAYLNLIHVDDFAGLVATTIDKVDGPGTFMLTDNRPVTQDKLMCYIADLLDVSCPVDVDKQEYTSAFGELLGETMVTNARVSSASTLDGFQYELKRKSFDLGIPATLRDMGYSLRQTALGGEKEEKAA